MNSIILSTFVKSRDPCRHSILWRLPAQYLRSEYSHSLLKKYT